MFISMCFEVVINIFFEMGFLDVDIGKYGRMVR